MTQLKEATIYNIEIVKQIVITQQRLFDKVFFEDDPEIQAILHQLIHGKPQYKSLKLCQYLLESFLLAGGGDQSNLAYYAKQQHKPTYNQVKQAVKTAQCREGKLNTEDPVSWSEALRPFDMKLAYVPYDQRKLRYFMAELVGLADPFLLSYYSGLSLDILRDPDEYGWVCESHVVILHRNHIVDPALGESRPAFDHWYNGFHTKRIFRLSRLIIGEACD